MRVNDARCDVPRGRAPGEKGSSSDFAFCCATGSRFLAPEAPRDADVGRASETMQSSHTEAFTDREGGFDPKIGLEMSFTTPDLISEIEKVGFARKNHPTFSSSIDLSKNPSPNLLVNLFGKLTKSLRLTLKAQDVGFAE